MAYQSEFELESRYSLRKYQKTLIFSRFLLEKSPDEVFNNSFQNGKFTNLEKTINSSTEEELNSIHGIAKFLRKTNVKINLLRFATTTSAILFNVLCLGLILFNFTLICSMFLPPFFAPLPGIIVFLDIITLLIIYIGFGLWDASESTHSVLVYQFLLGYLPLELLFVLNNFNLPISISIVYAYIIGIGFIDFEMFFYKMTSHAKKRKEQTLQRIGKVSVNGKQLDLLKKARIEEIIVPPSDVINYVKYDYFDSGIFHCGHCEHGNVIRTENTKSYDNTIGEFVSKTEMHYESCSYCGGTGTIDRTVEVYRYNSDLQEIEDGLSQLIKNEKIKNVEEKLKHLNGLIILYNEKAKIWNTKS